MPETKTEACWDRTEGCCMTDAFERGMRPTPRIRVRRRRPGDWPGVTGLAHWQVTCTSEECPGVAWFSSHQSAFHYATRSAAIHMPKHHTEGA